MIADCRRWLRHHAAAFVWVSGRSVLSLVRVMAGRCIRLLPVLVLLIGAAAAPAAEPELGFRQRFEADGLLLEATVTRIAHADAGEPALRAGEPVKVRFALSDLTGKPLTGAFPNGWMVLRPPDIAGVNADARCRVAVRRLQGSSLWNRAEVDLNSYAVLALNDDATISVLDPFGGFGGTRLLALVALDGIGEDWVELPE